MNLTPVYRTPSKPLPRWVMEIGAAIVLPIGILVLIAARILGRV